MIQVTISSLNSVAALVANQIMQSPLPADQVDNASPRKHRIYGVARGGIPAAYAVAQYIDNGSVTDDIADATCIVDDLIDSGATRERFAEHHPDLPFFALFNKNELTNKTTWIQFPWEAGPEGTVDHSATDVPLRLLQYVGEDTTRGGLTQTPQRFLSAWQHFTSGYGKNASDVLKVFEDGAENCNEMVLIKSIPLYSQCEHHLVPFFGVAHVAYIPNGKIAGLSKLSRVVDIFARRLQVQERLTNQIADALNDNLVPDGVAVVLECRHLCMESRGISQQGHITITSAMRGAFLDNPETRAEFMGFIQ